MICQITIFDIILRYLVHCTPTKTKKKKTYPDINILTLIPSLILFYVKKSCMLYMECQNIILISPYGNFYICTQIFHINFPSLFKLNIEKCFYPSYQKEKDYHKIQ